MCFKAYYDNGMVGTGKNFISAIMKAASDTQLKEVQVKVGFKYNIVLGPICLDPEV